MSFGKAEDFYLKVGENIKCIRKQRKIDQYSLSQKLGLSRASMVNIEKGRQRPSIFIIWQIAGILNANIDELIPPIAFQTEVEIIKRRLESNVEINEKQKVSFLQFLSNDLLD